MKHLIFTLLLIVSVSQTACSKVNENASPATPAQIAKPNSEKNDKYMTDPKYIEFYTLTNPDKNQLIKVIQTAISIVVQKMTVDNATPILGEGEFIYPKAGTATKIYDFNDGKWNGGDLRWSGSFKRKDEQSPFFEAMVYPSSKAETTLTDFDETYFTKVLGLRFIQRLTVDEMTLDELRKSWGNPSSVADLSKEELMNGREYAEYHYELLTSGQKLKVIFYINEKEQFNSKETKYPKNFSRIEIINETLQDPRVQNQMNRTVKVGDKCPATGFWTCDQFKPDDQGIFLRRGDTMPGQSFNSQEREVVEWRLNKPVADA
jgi:hypothetical protein